MYQALARLAIFSVGIFSRVTNSFPFRAFFLFGLVLGGISLWAQPDNQQIVASVGFVIFWATLFSFLNIVASALLVALISDHRRIRRVFPVAMNAITSAGLASYIGSSLLGIPVKVGLLEPLIGARRASQFPFAQGVMSITVWATASFLLTLGFLVSGSESVQSYEIWTMSGLSGAVALSGTLFLLSPWLRHPSMASRPYNIVNLFGNRLIHAIALTVIGVVFSWCNLAVLALSLGPKLSLFGLLGVLLLRAFSLVIASIPIPVPTFVVREGAFTALLIGLGWSVPQSLSLGAGLLISRVLAMGITQLVLLLVRRINRR